MWELFIFCFTCSDCSANNPDPRVILRGFVGILKICPKIEVFPLTLKLKLYIENTPNSNTKEFLCSQDLVHFTQIKICFYIYSTHRTLINSGSQRHNVKCPKLYHTNHQKSFSEIFSLFWSFLVGCRYMWLPFPLKLPQQDHFIAMSVIVCNENKNRTKKQTASTLLIETI